MAAVIRDELDTLKLEMSEKITSLEEQLEKTRMKLDKAEEAIADLDGSEKDLRAMLVKFEEKITNLELIDVEKKMETMAKSMTELEGKLREEVKSAQQQSDQSTDNKICEIDGPIQARIEKEKAERQTLEQKLEEAQMGNPETSEIVKKMFQEFQRPVECKFR